MEEEIFLVQMYRPYGKLYGAFTTFKRAYTFVREMIDASRFDSSYSYKEKRKQLLEGGEAEFVYDGGDIIGIINLTINQKYYGV